VLHFGELHLYSQAVGYAEKTPAYCSLVLRRFCKVGYWWGDYVQGESGRSHCMNWLASSLANQNSKNKPSQMSKNNLFGNCLHKRFGQQFCWQKCMPKTFESRIFIKDIYDAKELEYFISLTRPAKTSLHELDRFKSR
jgi:hypothetical protein